MTSHVLLKMPIQPIRFFKFGMSFIHVLPGKLILTKLKLCGSVVNGGVKNLSMWSGLITFKWKREFLTCPCYKMYRVEEHSTSVSQEHSYFSFLFLPTCLTYPSLLEVFPVHGSCPVSYQSLNRVCF